MYLQDFTRQRVAVNAVLPKDRIPGIEYACADMRDGFSSRLSDSDRVEFAIV